MKKSMIIRTLVLVVALVNQSLVLAGYSPLPFNDDQLEQGFTAVFTVVASLWAWWKNNDVTKKAIANQKKLEKLNE